MTDEVRVSNAFETFASEAPDRFRAWNAATEALGHACALDVKNRHLGYVAVLAVLGRESGVPFHVIFAKNAGASRDEVTARSCLACGRLATASSRACLQPWRPTTNKRRRGV